MADFDRLLGVEISRAAAEVAEPPDFAAIERRGVQRRRTHAVLTAAAAAVVVAVVSVGLFLASGTEDTAPSPAPEPSISESESPPPPSRTPDEEKQRFAALSPEQIRNRPDAKVRKGIDDRINVSGAPGVAARVWEVCLDVCRPGDGRTWGDGTLQWALEVTSDGYRTSALHEIPTMGNVSHAVDDLFLVTSREGPTLVDSTGRRDQLTEGATLPVTDIAGPLVFTGNPYAWLDLESRQLHAIDGTGGMWEWEPADDAWHWGSFYFVENSGRIGQRALVWRNPDGDFDVRTLPIDFDDYSTQMLRAGTPGTMAAVDPGPPALVHVSTDYGQSWEVRIIPPEVPRNSAGAIEDSTLPDDWETWPTP